MYTVTIAKRNDDGIYSVWSYEGSRSSITKEVRVISSAAPDTSGLRGPDIRRIAEAFILNTDSSRSPCGTSLYPEYLRDVAARNGICGVVVASSTTLGRAFLSRSPKSVNPMLKGDTSDSPFVGAFFARPNTEPSKANPLASFLYVDLLCCRGTGMIVDAVLRAFAKDAGFEGLSLSSVQNQVGFYQRAGYEVRASCAVDDALVATDAVVDGLESYAKLRRSQPAREFTLAAAKRGAVVRKDASCVPPATAVDLDVRAFESSRCLDDGISMKVCDLAAASRKPATIAAGRAGAAGAGSKRRRLKEGQKGSRPRNRSRSRPQSRKGGRKGTEEGRLQPPRAHSRRSVRTRTTSQG